MILNPAPPDPAGLLTALRTLIGVERHALAATLAGYRDELAGDLPRIAAVWAALLDLACAVRDDEAATINRVLVDVLTAGGPVDCEPDVDPGPPPVADQLAVFEAAFRTEARRAEAHEHHDDVSQ